MASSIPTKMLVSSVLMRDSLQAMQARLRFWKVVIFQTFFVSTRINCKGHSHTCSFWIFFSYILVSFSNLPGLHVDLLHPEALSGLGQRESLEAVGATVIAGNVGQGQGQDEAGQAEPRCSHVLSSCEWWVVWISETFFVRRIILTSYKYLAKLCKLRVWMSETFFVRRTILTSYEEEVFS